MFTKKKTAPTTVAEALSGFAVLKQQLIDVIALNVTRRAESARRIDDAKQYAVTVEEAETAAILVSDAEIKRAEAAESVISKLLGEDAVVPVQEAAPVQEAETATA